MRKNERGEENSEVFLHGHINANARKFADDKLQHGWLHNKPANTLLHDNL
jgi:hypothetical protein